MGRQQSKNHLVSRLVRIFALFGLVLVMAPTLPILAQSEGTARINVTSFADDGSTPLPFARFQVLNGDGELLATRETTPPDGKTSFTIDLTDDSEATYTVTMETPPACAIQPEDQVVGPFTDGDSIDLAFSVSFGADCTLGAISVYAYECPDGLDLTVDDYAQYRDNCVDTINDETFTLSELPEGGDSFDLVTGRYGIDGRAPIVGLIPGEFGLSQNGGDPDQTVVYCMTYDGTPIEAQSPSETMRRQFNSNGQVELDLEDRNRIACDFFSVSGTVPGADEGASGDDEVISEDDPAVEVDSSEGDVSASDEEAAPEGTDPATIEFHVATCPSGYDGGDHYNDCADNGTEDVEFTAIGQNTSYSASATSSVPVSPGFGIAIITGLPADTYTMSEEVPGDFVSLFVYCADSPGGGPRIPTPENGFQEFDIELAAGQSVICDWYITPDQQFEPATLRLTKFTCDPGYGGTSFADFTSDCTNSTEGVSFNLSNGSGFDLDKTTNGDGKIRYTDLAPGDDYVLTEDLPGDALDNRVAFCAIDGGDYIEYGVEANGSIDLDPISDGNQVQCLWYNVPADQGVGDGDGSVEVHFSVCPAGTTGDFYNRCHDNPQGNVDFSLSGPGSLETSGTTVDDGIVAFQELPNGGYVLTQVPLADFNLDFYAAFCTVDGEAIPTEYDDDDGMRLTFDLDEGADIICDWYNVPRGTATATPAPQAPTGGSVTVVKRLCLDDLDEIKDFATECEAYGSGVEFELTSIQSGSKAKGTTGSNSQVAFTGLANGAYALDELNGDWCKAQADHVDASGNVLVQGNSNTNVYIYNCGDRDINTLPSTGTGSAGGGVPLSFWAIGLVAVAVFGASFAVRPALSPRRHSSLTVPVRIGLKRSSHFATPFFATASASQLSIR